MGKSTNDPGTVSLHVENGVGTITFFHPASNSLPGNLLKALADTISRAGSDEAIRVIVLKSGGERAFCAGASFDELMAIENPEEGKRFFLGFANVINALRKVPQFVIGRVQGKVVGGGVGLASAVDYCLATTYASVKLSELAIGIGPFVVGPAVERKMGVSAMSELAIDATEWRTAAWARDRGLFAEIFEDIPSLDEGVDRLAAKLARSNPEAMAKLKKGFWRGTEDWDTLLDDRAAMSGTLVLSDFTISAIQKFKANAR